VAGCCAIAALKNPTKTIVRASAVTAALRSDRAHKIAYDIRSPQVLTHFRDPILKEVLKDVLKTGFLN
jgi:hypothetical protein